jgi:hypothetical protein
MGGMTGVLVPSGGTDLDRFVKVGMMTANLAIKNQISAGLGADVRDAKS